MQVTTGTTAGAAGAGAAVGAGADAGANVSYSDQGRDAETHNRSATAHALEARQDPKSLIGQRIHIEGRGTGTVTGMKTSKGKATKHLIAFSSGKDKGVPVQVLLQKDVNKGKGLKFYILHPDGATAPATSTTGAKQGWRQRQADEADGRGGVEFSTVQQASPLHGGAAGIDALRQKAADDVSSAYETQADDAELSSAGRASLTDVVDDKGKIRLPCDDISLFSVGTRITGANGGKVSGQIVAKECAPTGRGTLTIHLDEVSLERVAALRAEQKSSRSHPLEQEDLSSWEGLQRKTFKYKANRRIAVLEVLAMMVGWGILLKSSNAAALIVPLLLLAGLWRWRYQHFSGHIFSFAGVLFPKPSESSTEGGLKAPERWEAPPSWMENWLVYGYISTTAVLTWSVGQIHQDSSEAKFATACHRIKGPPGTDPYSWQYQFGRTHAVGAGDCLAQNTATLAGGTYFLFAVFFWSCYGWQLSNETAELLQRSSHNLQVDVPDSQILLLEADVNATASKYKLSRMSWWIRAFSLFICTIGGFSQLIGGHPLFAACTAPAKVQVFLAAPVTICNLLSFCELFTVLSKRYYFARRRAKVASKPFLCFAEPRHIVTWYRFRKYQIDHELPILYALGSFGVGGLLLFFSVTVLMVILLVFVKYSDQGINAFTREADIVMLLILSILLSFWIFKVLGAAVHVWMEQRSHLKLLHRARIGLHAAAVAANQQPVATDALDANLSSLFVHNEGNESSSSLLSKTKPEAKVLLDSTMIDHILEDIKHYDEAPTVLTIRIKPELFILVKGYILSAVLAIVTKMVVDAKQKETGT